MFSDFGNVPDHLSANTDDSKKKGGMIKKGNGRFMLHFALHHIYSNLKSHSIRQPIFRKDSLRYEAGKKACRQNGDAVHVVHQARALEHISDSEAGFNKETIRQTETRYEEENLTKVQQKIQESGMRRREGVTTAGQRRAKEVEIHEKKRWKKRPPCAGKP